jgi:hypothetical protein
MGDHDRIAPLVLNFFPDSPIAISATFLRGVTL